MSAGGGTGVVFDDGTLAVQARQWSIGGGLSIAYDAEGRPQLKSSTAVGAHPLGDHTDVTITSPSAGHFLRYNGSAWVNAAIAAGDVPSHDIISKHSASGLTAGHFMKATGATTFAFQAHGLTYGDVGAAAASHTHAAGDIISGLLPLARGGTGASLSGLSTDSRDLIVGAPDGSSLGFVDHPKAVKTLQATAEGDYLWADAGTIGGSVAATYIPYASAANTLASSPLYRTTSSLVQGDCDLYLHSEIDHYFRLYTYGDNVGYMGGYGAGGTKSTPTATATQWVLQLGGYGYDGASWTQGAYIGFYAPTTWEDSPAEHGMFIQFGTRNGADASVVARWRISEGGTFHCVGSSYSIGASTIPVASIYVNYVYGQHHMEVTTASDSAAVEINYSGYQGGTTYYRDFNVYDGKHQVLFSIDGSYHAVKVPGGLLLVDGIDSTVPTGNIGFAESGGSFTMSGRHNIYFGADNDANSQTAVHGFYWQTSYDPIVTKMSLLYNTTASAFLLTLNDNRIYAGAGLRMVGSAAAGNSNLSYIAFYANDGTTRTGYIGEASAGNRDIYVYADVGNIRLSAPSGSVLVSSITATSSYGFTVQPSAGAAVFRAFGYQSQARLDLNTADGGPGSETAVSATTIGELRFYGYDGAAYFQGAGILAYALTTWDDSPAEHSCRLIFYTTHTTGALTSRWRIESTGHLLPYGASYNIGDGTNRVSILYVNEIDAHVGGPTDPSYMFDGYSTTGLYYNSGVGITVAGTAVAAFQAGKLIPATNGYDLGDASYRWDAYLQNALVYGQTYPGNGIFYPTSTPDHRDVIGPLTINWNNNQTQTVSMGNGALQIYIDNSSNMQLGTAYYLIVFGSGSYGDQNLSILGVDIWIGTSWGSAKALGQDKMVTVTLIKVRTRADDGDIVIAYTGVDAETAPT